VRWAEYAEASRRLAEIAGQEAARQSESQQRAVAGRAAVEQLQRRLAAQRDHLAEIAVRLREPPPPLDGAARTGLADADEAIRRAAQAINQADAEARQAEERGMRPALFPTMSTNGRNALVYSAAAFGMWLVSCGLYSFSSRSGSAPIGLLLWSMCGLPAIAFFAGYVVISVFGRARVQSLGQVHHSARLGGLICVGGMFGAWIVFLAATALLRA
jgi:hypothetical protein